MLFCDMVYGLCKPASGMGVYIQPRFLVNLLGQRWEHDSSQHGHHTDWYVLHLLQTVTFAEMMLLSARQQLGLAPWPQSVAGGGAAGAASDAGDGAEAEGAAGGADDDDDDEEEGPDPYKMEAGEEWTGEDPPDELVEAGLEVSCSHRGGVGGMSSTRLTTACTHCGLEEGILATHFVGICCDIQPWSQLCTCMLSVEHIMCDVLVLA
jgi:hypothetical protein